MKFNNFTATMFILVTLLAFVSITYPQTTKRTKVGSKPTVQRAVSLTDEQKSYLETIIEQADSADSKYSLYTLGLPDYPGFSEKVGEMFKVEKVNLPEPIESQANHLISSYSGWSKLFELMTRKGKPLDNIQYQAQLDAILESYDLNGMASTSAINSLKTIAQNSKNKLKLMMTNPSKRINPDRFFNRNNIIRNNIILVPAPTNSNQSQIAPKAPENQSRAPLTITDTSNKSTEPNLKSLVGKWRFSILENNKPIDFVDIVIVNIDNGYFFGVLGKQNQNQNQTVLIPVKIENGSVLLNAYTLLEGNKILNVKLDSNILDVTSMKGKLYVKGQGQESINEFNATRISQ